MQPRLTFGGAARARVLAPEPCRRGRQTPEPIPLDLRALRGVGVVFVDALALISAPARPHPAEGIALQADLVAPEPPRSCARHVHVVILIDQQLGPMAGPCRAGVVVVLEADIIGT